MELFKKNDKKNINTISGCDECHPKSPNGTSFSFIGEYF